MSALPPKADIAERDSHVRFVRQSNLDPLTADKVTDLRNMFQDAHTGWLEIYEEAA